MSMLGTLAKVAAGAMVARGVGKMMSGQGGMGGGMGGAGGGLGGMLGGMMRGGMQGGGGGLGGLGGMLGGGTPMGGQAGRGTPMGGQMGGMGGGLGGLLSGARGGGGGLGGLLESLGGGAVGGAMGGNAQAQQQQLPNQPANGSLGDVLNSAFDGFGVEPTQEQEDQASLLLKAMIAAAKSDGQIDQAEREKLLGQMGDATPQEVEFVKQELAAPLDLEGLVASVPAGMQQQVYLMSLMAIDLDSPAEAKYLDSLARGLNLAPEVCNAIHDKLGAPRLYS